MPKSAATPSVSSSPDQNARKPSSHLRTLDYVAERLGLSYWGARDLVQRGYLPAIRLPGRRPDKNLRRILIDERDLEKFIEEHREVRAIVQPAKARRVG